MSSDYLEMLDLEVIADERAAGEETYLTDGEGRMYADGRDLFNLFPLSASERALFCRHLANAEEFRLFVSGGTPLVAVCVGFAASRTVPVIVPRGEAARELCALKDGERLHPHLSVCHAASDSAPVIDLSHAHDLFALLDRAFLFAGGGSTQSAAVLHVLSTRAAALARLFGCRVRFDRGGFGFAPLPTPDYGWFAGVMTALMHLTKRAGAEQTLDLLFDRPEPDLPLCHALIRLTDAADPLPELTPYRGADVRGALFSVSTVPDRPDLLHVAFSLSARELSRQGVRADPGYKPDIPLPPA